MGPWSDEISALIRKDTGGNSLVVQWLGLSASTATALVQSLAGVEGGGRHEDSLPLPPSLPQFLPVCVCVCVQEGGFLQAQKSTLSRVPLQALTWPAL